MIKPLIFSAPTTTTVPVMQMEDANGFRKVVDTAAPELVVPLSCLQGQISGLLGDVGTLDGNVKVLAGRIVPLEAAQVATAARVKTLEEYNSSWESTAIKVGAGIGILGGAAWVGGKLLG